MLLSNCEDIPDVLNRCLAEGGLVLCESQLDPAFFDLRTRIAGELFQKIVNYQSRLAIVVRSPAQYSDRFGELVHEHRRHGNIRFFDTTAQALEWLGESGQAH